MKPLAVAAGIIENGQGEILIAQRPPGSRLEGLWEFPGGKFEPGEDGEQALQRELFEELELRVKILGSLGVYPYIYPWGEIHLHVFRVSALNTPTTTAAVHVFNWVSPKALKVNLLAPADVEPFYFYLRSAPQT